jgi:hypothetical protein
MAANGYYSVAFCGDHCNANFGRSRQLECEFWQFEVNAIRVAEVRKNLIFTSDMVSNQC